MQQNPSQSKLVHKHLYAELGEAAGPYVHAVSHQNLLFTSGFTAFGTEAQTRDIATQIREIYGQLEIIAHQHHTGLESLIKVTIFVSDLSDLASARNALMDVYQGDYPASSLVKVDALFHPDLKVEVEGVFALSSDDGADC